MTTIDVADLDTIFLSYDEPNKEEHWIKIKNMVPWAKRVDGVKGSDAGYIRKHIGTAIFTRFAPNEPLSGWVRLA